MNDCLFTDTLNLSSEGKDMNIWLIGFNSSENSVQMTVEKTGIEEES